MDAKGNLSRYLEENRKEREANRWREEVKISDRRIGQDKTQSIDKS